MVRVPLYTQPHDALGRRVGGLPLFLCNTFAGNAKQQLLYGLICTGLMSKGEVEEACKLAEQQKSIVV